MKTWNYRLCTMLLVSPTGTIDGGGAKIFNETRIFTISRVYYTDSIAHSWGEPINDKAETIDELKEDFLKMSNAFNEPILDLDNFPNIYNA